MKQSIQNRRQINDFWIVRKLTRTDAEVITSKRYVEIPDFVYLLFFERYIVMFGEGIEQSEELRIRR
jgi:hypothetical protein